MTGPGVSWAHGEAHRAELRRQADRSRQSDRSRRSDRSRQNDRSPQSDRSRQSDRYDWSKGDHRSERYRDSERYGPARPIPGQVLPRAGARTRLGARLRRALIWLRRGGRDAKLNIADSA